MDNVSVSFWIHVHLDDNQNTEDLELIPDREDALPDSPLEDTVSYTLKRENSIRRSQRSRFEHAGVVDNTKQNFAHCTSSCKAYRSVLLCMLSHHINFFLSFFSSFRLRKNSNLKTTENVDETKRGERLIEKEAMETGTVRDLELTQMTELEL